MVPRAPACEPAGAGHFHTLAPHRSLARRLLTQLSVTRGNPHTFPLEADPRVSGCAVWFRYSVQTARF